jgi:hypothetical protein
MELQERHSGLIQSYKTLQFEYSALKLELDAARRESQDHENEPLSPGSFILEIVGQDNLEMIRSDELSFDGGSSCYDDSRVIE